MMAPSLPATPAGPAARADAVVRDVLRTQWQGLPALRLDSPPGAGKTDVVERLAVQAVGLMDERCMIVTQTNEQAFDVARRLGEHYPRLTFWLYAKKGLAIPRSVRDLANVAITDDVTALPSGPCVAIGNAAKWSWVDEDQTGAFDLQVVDEAFQLADYQFLQIANLARRVVLVGDPGQIAPIVRGETERWACDPAGPHIACPDALLARHPSLPRRSLPVTRRLPPDTVRIVQPAFYPELPFGALSAPGDRQLRTALAGTTVLDGAIDLAVGGASIVQAELPSLVTGEHDPELAASIVSLIERLLARGTTVVDDGVVRPLTPDMTGVACAHVSQVYAVRERLPATLTGVFVETGNRFQGLERPVMIVHHPISGRADAGDFHLDAGRLCVMLSRHRIACFVLTRAGIGDMLTRYAPSGDRVLGIDRDAEYEGWRAHASFQEQLRMAARVVLL